jgi:hypothetical protein
VTYFYSPASKNLNGRHFGTFYNIQMSVIIDELEGIPAEAFQQCYEQWKHCLRRFISAQGNYF